MMDAEQQKARKPAASLPPNFGAVLMNSQVFDLVAAATFIGYALFL
jgi:hypothetical protein